MFISSNTSRGTLLIYAQAYKALKINHGAVILL